MTPNQAITSEEEKEERAVESASVAVPDRIALAYTCPMYSYDERLGALAVAEDLSGGIQRLTSSDEELEVELLAIDRRLFESDIRSSALLEVGAGRLLLPYKVLQGERYLGHWEREYKRRKIVESISSLALDHRELLGELLIDPRYFVHDVLAKHLPLRPRVSQILRAVDEAGPLLLSGYLEALRTLEQEGAILTRSGLVSVDADFIDSLLNEAASVPDQLATVERKLRGLIRLGLTGTLPPIQVLYRSPFESFLSAGAGASDIPRPERFLHFPTATGLASLSASIGIEEMLAKVEPSSAIQKTRLQRFGSVLNEVYLLSYSVEDERRRAVLKRYPNWSSLKWAPLALWTLGTQNFALLGRSRMERECATTSLLSREGLPVPKILQTDFEDRLILREYVHGENIRDVVKSIIHRKKRQTGNLELIGRVGRAIAAVHRLGATLGDCKPENFIVSEGTPFIIDLEQGGKGGNVTWDLAEFLYFAGHYAAPLDLLKGVAEITTSFIKGYADAGGDKRKVSEAGRLKYTKVFTPFTLPQVIYTIAKTCRTESK